MKKAFYVVLLYVIFGFIWVYFSDRILFDNTDSVGNLLLIENLKGYTFVILSGLLIYVTQYSVYRQTLREHSEIQSLYDNPSLGLIKTSREGIIIEVSSNIYKWLELTPEEVIGKSINELLAADQDEFECSTILEKIPAPFEKKFISGSGDEISLAISCSRNAKSQLYSATNISTQNDLRGELRSQLFEKISLVNSIDDLIWSIDTDFKLKSYNNAFQKAFVTLLGRPIKSGETVLQPEFGEDISDLWRNLYSRCLNGEKFTDQIAFKTQESDVHIEINLNPITGDDGEIVGVSCFSHDITQKAWIDQEKDQLIHDLEDKNEFIETVLENIPLGIVVSDLTRDTENFINENFWKIYGWKKEDFINKESFYEKIFPDPEYRKIVKQKFQDDTESGDSSQMIWRNLQVTTRNNEKKVIDCQNIPIPGQDIMIAISMDSSELYRSLEKLDLIIDAGRIGTWTYDLSHEHMIINDYWAAMLGYTKEEVTRQPRFFVELLHPEDRARFNSEMNRLKSGAVQNFSLELRLKSREGDYRWVINNGRVVRNDSSGNPVQLAGIHLDISQQKISEEELLKSREKYQWILEKMTDAYVVFDNDWNYVYCNDRAAEMLHMKKEDLIGNNIWEIFPHDVGGKFYNLLHQVKEEQVAQSVELYYEPWDVWYYDFIFPSEEGIAVFYQDVSKRKKVELELKKRDDSLQIFLQNASDAILACNDRGQIIFYNKTLRNWIDLEDLDFTPPQWPGKYKPYTMDGSRPLKKNEYSHLKALEKETIKNEELMIRSKGLPPRYVEVNGSAMFDRDNRKIGAMIVMRDITDRFEREVVINSSILDTLEKERASIASEIHDGLGQYLGISSMNLQNLALDFEQLTYDQRYLQAQEFLELSIDNCRNIAHQLMPKSVQDLGLAGSVEELIDVYNRNEIFQTVFQCNIKNRPSPEVELHLYRVIQEAMNNIRKHAEARSCNISLQTKLNSLHLTIIDDGNGFDIDSSSRNLTSGLGLTTMKRRIQKLEGVIEIESDMGGTAIHVSIPIEKISAETPAPHE